MRQFSHAEVEWFKSAVVRGDCSRYELARQFCVQTGWHNPAGQPSIAQVYQALPRLAEALSLALPAARSRRPVKGELPVYRESVALRMAWSELGEIRVEPVRGGERQQWRSMMATFHPQGNPQLPGRCCKCWIVSVRQGRLGGCRFMPPAGMSVPVTRILDGAVERGWSICTRFSTSRDS